MQVPQQLQGLSRRPKARIAQDSLRRKRQIAQVSVLTILVSQIASIGKPNCRPVRL